MVKDRTTVQPASADKPVTYSVAIILRDYRHPERFLLVKRPENDVDLGGHWGLPATSLRPGELPEEAARRAVREKLGCNAMPGRFVGMMFQKRNSYDIFLMDIEMLLCDGQQPDVHKANTTSTVYTEQKWTSDPGSLLASAKAGSCCSSILLNDRGLFSRSDWVTSLEGMAVVG